MGGTSHLYRFRYSPVTRVWTADDPVSYNNSAKHIALAARGNTLAACFFNSGTTTVRGESIIYYLKGDYTWGSYDEFDPTTSFAWDPHYAAAYWQMGPGFAVGTCLTDSGSAQLQILHWQRNYTGFSDRSTTVTGGNVISQVAGSVIVNGGTMLRYDGSSWQSTQIGWEENSDFVAVTDDAVLRARKSGSYFTDNVLCTYKPVDGAWKTATFAGDDPPEADSHAIGPQFSSDFLTLGGQVFTRGGDNDWQSTASTSQLPHASGSTVANLGPSFITWQNGDNRDNPNSDTLNSYAALLKNGDILTVADPFGEQKVQTVNGTAVLCGATAFATYASNISDFSKVGSFTLHRVLNQAVSDPTDCVVTKLTIETANQSLSTTYDYDQSKAVFDPSGTVAQFPTVTATRLSALDGTTTMGKTVYQYYNGLSGEQDPYLKESLNNFYSLANGYMHTVSEYDADDQLVAVTQNSWAPITYTDDFVALAQVATLKSGSVVHQFPNLSVIPLDGSSAGERNGHAHPHPDVYLR